MKIEISGLAKTYDGTQWAVKDLELTIPSGTIFGLIGPNGAGKTTALRMLATVLQPTAGKVLYDGEVLHSDATELRRKIGFLGDGNPLYKHLTASEYLRFFGQCFHIPDNELEPAIDETLGVFGLGEKRDVACGLLSKGMRQRLLIARCLLHKPKLLILDEPADGLDPRGRSELREILKQARQRGVTVVVSSHILRELDDLCDRVAILQGGLLVVDGGVGEIIENSATKPFVYQIRVLDERARAEQFMRTKRIELETSGVEDGLFSMTLQVAGGEPSMAELLAQMIGEGLRVVTVSRVRSRLEDVYNQLSEDRLN
ncbi:MAG: ABC transporter ATP-binding protein [Nannocystaceae bacterium]